MCVLHFSSFAMLPPTPVRLHSCAPPKLFASQTRLSSAEGSHRGPTNSRTLKRKRDEPRYQRRPEKSAFTFICQRRQSTPQASIADASTERRPKVVGLGLACWDFLAQVAAFPKPDEKLRTQKMEVLHTSTANPDWPRSR